MKRESDLQSLSQLAASRQYHYKSAAFDRFNNSAGMARPDEVVVIYNDSIKYGKKFGEQNSDLIQKNRSIQQGLFNQVQLPKHRFQSIVNVRKQSN